MYRRATAGSGFVGSRIFLRSANDQERQIVARALAVQVPAHGGLHPAADLGCRQAAQRRQDAELAEHSRLLLERSMETSYANVERVAQSQLGMVFPETAEQVEP